MHSVKNEDEAYEIYTRMLSTLEDYEIINSIQKQRFLISIQNLIKIENVLTSILENTKSENTNSGEDYRNIFCLTIIRTDAPILRNTIGGGLFELLLSFWEQYDHSLYDLFICR